MGKYKHMVGISIIIPCYNCQNTIIRALNSINLKNEKVEAIVIDDCSTDKSYSIVASYIKENPSYNIILKKNQYNLGPGETRNRALNIASKDYITFLDSDDTFCNNYFDELNSILKQDNYDCIIFDAINTHKDKSKYFNMFFSNSINKGLIAYKDAFVYTKGCTCGKLYKKNIIEKNSIKFANTKRGEDLVFTKLALANCRKIFYLKVPLYNYIYNGNSIMNNQKTYIDAIENVNNVYCLIKSKIDNLKWQKQLNSIYMLEVIYVTAMHRIRLSQSYKEQKSSFINLLKYYNQNDPYFSRYNYKYKLIFKLLRAIFCSV